MLCGGRIDFELMDGPLPCAGDCDADGTSGNFAHDCAHHAQEDREYQERHELVEDEGWGKNIAYAYQSSGASAYRHLPGV